MTLVNAASRTPLAYSMGELNAHRLFAMVNKLNELIEDQHDFTGLMDLDAGITDVDYEATLTAAQIDHNDYTPTEAAPAPIVGLFGQFPVNVVSEEIAKVLSAQCNASIVDTAAIIAKLNLDAGVVATNFDTAQFRAARLIQRADLDEDQDDFREILMLVDRWHYGELLAVGTADTAAQVQMYRSTNDGRSWSVLSTFPATVDHVRGLMQDGNRLLAFTTETATPTLYESLDFGRSWTDVTSRLPTITSTGWRRGLRSEAGTILMAGNAAGEIVRSPDGGVTFTLVTVTGPTGFNTVREAPQAGKIMVTGDDDVILYSSADEGASFAVEEDFSTGNTNAMDFLELANGFWAVTVRDSAGVDELEISQDAGATFEAPVAVTGAVDELDRMIQGPDGTLYIGVGVNIQTSQDNGATVDVATAGIDLPANDLTVPATGKNRHGEVIIGTRNTTDFGGLWLIGVTDAEQIDAFDEDVTGSFSPLGPQDGEGASGAWLDWVHDQVTRSIESWQALGAMMDLDASVVTVTYEAAIAEAIPTKARKEAPRDLHNAGHGAGA